ncbi:lipopolysaccharide assembly protein LapB [Nocardia sp. CS682]|uniref:tetratricopeptide repeat protein n=1 Tax=Nocardia sp. CS682 TaxID=1047172 RepID=UPI001074FA82|nr:hypothetical protein [Nocardia sp. CS682]QBS44650.1 hypothetical protein DMB37_35770 [Nocardia sp. CS682]
MTEHPSIYSALDDQPKPKQHTAVRPLRPRAVAGIVVAALAAAAMVGAVATLPSLPGIATAEAPGTTSDRFYALPDLAKDSFTAGDIEAAREYAQELLAITPGFHDNWNYGNAIHDANMVLGRIALREGRVHEAKAHLLAAGNSPGSPQMDTFGPNMSLAKDLLEHGERQVVLEYFELCRRFWEMHNGRLDRWSQLVLIGVVPDFGANSVY